MQAELDQRLIKAGEEVDLALTALEQTQQRALAHAVGCDRPYQSTRCSAISDPELVEKLREITERGVSAQVAIHDRLVLSKERSLNSAIEHYSRRLRRTHG